MDPRLPVNDSAVTEAFRRDLVAGLKGAPKSIPSKYLYDEEGSRLFEKICELDEYYPTRTELGILEADVREMAEILGPGCLVIEYGTGSGRKTSLLLEALDAPVGYVPIDISCEHLTEAMVGLAKCFPALEVHPVCADYSQEYRIPATKRPARRRVVYFPGSSIGNFDRDEATAFLTHAAGVVGPGGALLIGVDLRKSPAVLERAYDDAEGVTAAFNRNLLVRANRELGADFDVERFRHRAVWNDREGRIEMHLESLADQEVRIGGERFRFRRGETIHTENSHKYTIEGFQEIAAAAGFRAERVWTDHRRYFSVHCLVVD